MDLSILADTIRKAEGFRPSAYMDTRGYWTIGYGTLIDKRGGGISTNEADILMMNRLQKAANDVFTNLPWVYKISSPRQNALFEMAFQMGINGLLDFKNMLSDMEAYNFNDAAMQALNSDWARQTPQRASRIALAIKSG